MTNTCARCGVDIQPLGFNSGLWASTSTGGTGCTVDGVAARHAPQPTEPSTPTVDIDDTVPWSGGPSTTTTVPPLARPVPAAPAEPGATEVERGAIWGVVRPFLSHMERNLHGPTERGRAEADVLAVEIADAVLAAALAASSAPADEGREEADLLAKACELLGDVPWSGSERHRRWRITSNNLLAEAEALFAAPLPAASPAPAAPEERDEADLTANQAAEALLDVWWTAEHNPLEITNSAPLARQIMTDLYGAGFVVAARPAPEPADRSFVVTDRSGFQETFDATIAPPPGYGVLWGDEDPPDRGDPEAKR